MPDAKPPQPVPFGGSVLPLLPQRQLLLVTEPPRRVWAPAASGQGQGPERSAGLTEMQQTRGQKGHGTLPAAAALIPDPEKCLHFPQSRSPLSAPRTQPTYSD